MSSSNSRSSTRNNTAEPEVARRLLMSHGHDHDYDGCALNQGLEVTFVRIESTL